MRRSSQSGNQQLKQHLLSGLQCRKRLVADILFWDGKQWGTGEIINNYSLTINLQISANILIAMPIDISNNSNVYALAWDATVRNAVKLFCANNGPSNLVGYVAICR